MIENSLNIFKEKLKNGIVLGPFMKSCDPAFVEAAGNAGCDFGILDMEHGPVGYEQLQNNIRGGEASGLLPIVRVDTLNAQSVSKALDAGAAGVQIPQICTASQAREAVRAARFAPRGERGVCRFVRAARYSALAGERYYRQADHALLIIQLEGQEALDNLDEILSVEGIDIIFLGPYDLSQSLGLTGQIGHPAVVQRMMEVVGKAREKGVTAGTFVDSREELYRWMRAGVKYISYSVDVGIFYEACVNLKKCAEDMAARLMV